MIRRTFFVVGLSLVFALGSCGDKKENEESNEEGSNETTEAPKDTVQEEEIPDDPHSFSNPFEVGTSHLHLEMDVDFETRTISGSATYNLIHRDNKGVFVIDINGIDITSVVLDDGTETTFEKIGEDDLLGDGVAIKIGENTQQLTVNYQTTNASNALQWLEPSQTAGKNEPYLFTQGQAILTRTWVPCQDTPTQRITYSAKVTCPVGLMAVMSASNPVERNETGVYEFEMRQSIPSYLIALAVGDIDFKPIGDRTGVYTEPSLIQASAAEFEDMEKMLVAAERLYGEYKWDRYDVIVLPPSFPYGGMENPRLTFATPTILAGDKSLVALIAHEMAHSWSGNLVTNATWDDFWLNEGFTVYFENRIMEEVYGKDYSDMLLMLSEQELRGEIAGMLDEGKREDTFLKLRLADRDPEDGLTSIAYDKGAFFLKMLENNVGREKWDAFLKGYFDEHQFQTMTTEKFVAYLNKNLLEPGDYNVNVDEWVYSEGLPESHVKIMSDKFDLVETGFNSYTAGDISADELAALCAEQDWTYQQKLHMVRRLDENVSLAQMNELDQAFGFSKEGNSEILSEWFVRSINLGYNDVNPEVEKFLKRVGRAKFLKPIYTALAQTEAGLTMAREIYKDARKNYHSVSTNRIDQILSWEG